MNKTLKILFLLSVPLLMVLALTSCITEDLPSYYDEIQSDSIEGSTITVSGVGNKKVTTDEVSVNITILTEEETSEEAVSKNTNISDDVIESLKSLEIIPLSIETVSYNLNPVYFYPEENKPEIYAYEVRTMLEASTTEIKSIGEIIATAVDAGASSISSVRFDMSETLQRNAQSDALAEAALDANNKAWAITNALGLQLGDAYQIRESGTSYPGPIYTMDLERALGMGGETTAPDILPEEIEVSAYVDITYMFSK